MPQMPDTRIALSGLGGGGGQPSSGPLGTLGSLMQIKEQQQQNEIRKRALEEDDALDSALKQFERRGDAVEHLYRQGYQGAASRLAKSVYDERKQEIDQQTAEMSNTAKRLEMAGQIMSAVNDDQSLRFSTPALGSLLEPVFGKGIYDQLGTKYDEGKKKMLMDWGTNRITQINEQHLQQQEGLAKWQAGQIADPVSGMWSPQGLAIRQGYRSELANDLATAQNKEQWEYYLTKAHERKVPDDIVTEFGPWTTNAAERAFAIGLTGPQEATYDVGKDRAETAADREARLLAAAGGGGARGGMTAYQTWEAEGKKDKENEDTEDWAQEQFDSAFRLKKNWPKGPDGKPKKPSFDLSLLPEADQQEFVKRKLRTENNDRRKRGLLPLDAAARRASQSGDTEGYAKLQEIYNSLTNGLVPRLEEFIPPPSGAIGAQGTAAAPASPPSPAPPTSRPDGGRGPQEAVFPGVGPTPGGGPFDVSAPGAPGFAEKRARVAAVNAQIQRETDPQKIAALYQELGTILNLNSR